AGGLAGGGDEHPGGPAGPFQVGGDLVLHRDRVVFAVVAERPGTGGHPADPLEHIQVVGALVEQGAAAVLLPAAPPAAAGVVSVGAVPVGHRPADPLDAAQFAAVHSCRMA